MGRSLLNKMGLGKSKKDRFEPVVNIIKDDSDSIDSKIRTKISELRDLETLAKKVNSAPPIFDRAYVRDGQPKWDTVGCNKVHFSKETIVAAKAIIDNLNSKEGTIAIHAIADFDKQKFEAPFKK